jgi:hypothetical protein
VNRREFLRQITGAAAGRSLAANGQQNESLVIGCLNPGSPEPVGVDLPAFRQGLYTAGPHSCRASGCPFHHAPAAAQFQKELDQLALLPDNRERLQQELEFCSALGAVLRGAPENPSASGCGNR